MPKQFNPDLEYQNTLRRNLMFAHRIWVKDQTWKQEQFMFNLSLMRACKISWQTIAEALGVTRQHCWDRYHDKVFDQRDDIQEYAAKARLDRSHMLRLACELSIDMRFLDAELHTLVQRYREHGASWATVGRALGVSRQAARQRFGGVTALVALVDHDD